jgi:DNA helicase-2/ATP-dependent DNA helicase PcrA
MVSQKQLNMTTIEQIINLIEHQKSYVLEAGAGSGKTYTLIQTINYLIENKGKDIKLKNQRIVCITYTNVAKNEIIDRLENNPLVIVSTIHEFLWDCIKPYNKQLVIELDKLNSLMYIEKPEKFQLGLIERIHEVVYDDSSFRDFEKGQLHHDDVIALSKQMFESYSLLTTMIADKYPYILVDEYQDTAVETVSALIESLLERNNQKVLLGFYGDSYQKIYDTGVGSLQNFVDQKKISLVTKEENYRSSENVVKLLNKVRSNIVQMIPTDIIRIDGSVTFINCNNYPPIPSKGIIEYEKSLMPIKNINYNKIISKLEADGWSFGENSEDKILIIVNSRVAERAGFGDLYKIFSTRYGEGANEALLKRENAFSSFFIGSVDKKTSKERETGIEHLISFWEKEDYNSVMQFLKRNTRTINSSFSLKKHPDKKKIKDIIESLNALCVSETVKKVFDFVIENKIVLLPKYIADYQTKINVDIANIEDKELQEKTVKDKKFYDDLMRLPYIQFRNLFKHTQDQTVFSTKHGTKGEEYRNVLMIIDDTSWKQKYNFQNFIDNTEEKPDRKLRTQNLFYVSCSRAKENLVVLSLSEMKEPALAIIRAWFADGNVQTIAEY